MINFKELISNTISLISVASEDWLYEENNKFKKSIKESNSFLLEKKKILKFRLIKDKGKRINEIDAQIELLKVSVEHFEEIESYIIKLMKIRKKILKESKV